MEILKEKIKVKTILTFTLIGFVLVFFIVKKLSDPDSVYIKFDIQQNQEAIYLSTFAEPPQFAIWIENEKTGEKQTVFVTHRSGIGDWEGKPAVPVAIPRWSELFVNKDDLKDHKEIAAVSGATPKEESFSVSVEVPEGSIWTCWIEMNLAGDFNEFFTEFNAETLVEDEFFCGQPALLYKAIVTAQNNYVIKPKLMGQSVWEDRIIRVEAVNAGVTTAKGVFEDIKISVTK